MHCATLAVSPMNFSFLCGRVEILVHPEAPDRAGAGLTWAANLYRV